MAKDKSPHLKPYEPANDPYAGVKIQQTWARMGAEKQARDAGAYEKHGANANSIKTGSSAKAPHDTDGM